MNEKASGKGEMWILLGIPAIGLIGTGFHFLYHWSGGSPLVGIIAPVNESVWEHLKMNLWPAALWWGGGYWRLRRHKGTDAAAWSLALLGTVLAAQAVVVLGYYFCAGALGIHALWADVVLYLLATAAGQLVGLRLYRRPSRISALLPLVLLGLWAAVFALFTFFPPELPIFAVPGGGTAEIYQNSTMV